MFKKQLQQDLNKSLKLGDKLKRSVLGMVVTAIQNKEINKRTHLSKTIKNIKELETKCELTDDEVIETIASEIKKRKESIEQFNAGGRPELAEKETSEIEILKAYLPAQMDEPEIEAEIIKIIEETGANSVKDMGKVIGAVMAKLKGKADGNAVSRIVKEKLTQ